MKLIVGSRIQCDITGLQNRKQNVLHFCLNVLHFCAEGVSNSHYLRHSINEIIFSQKLLNIERCLNEGF